MIVYNTTFHIENDILEECLHYFQESYIPKAVSSGFLKHPFLRRILHTPSEEGSSYCVQFHVKNMDTLNYWIQNEGVGLQKELVDRFGSKVVGFTTLLEEINWEK